MSVDRPGADDVVAAVETLAGALGDAEAGDQWDAPAGALTWSCRYTLAHVADCLVWYAANLARRSTAPAEVAEMATDADVSVLIDALRSGGALLAAVVEAADPRDRGWHLFGIADRSGFAAMGCDEVLVHGYDLTAGLGVPYDPPVEVCRHVLQRLFPWAPTDVDPWAALLWANGRASLGEEPPERRWLWHCAPLDEWDGQIRRRP